MTVLMLLITALFGAMSAVPAVAGELHVEVRRVPGVTGKAPPTVQVIGEDVPVALLSPGKWKYALEKQVFAKLNVVPGTEEVPEYGALPLSMKLPVTLTRPLAVLVVSTKREQVSARVALELYEKELKGKTDQFLWSFYQRAQLQARERFAQIQAREMNHSDVRVFFKVLEVARELGRKRYLTISPELDSLKEHLAGALDQPSQKSVIETALRQNTPHLVTLIQEINDLEADQYAALWDEIDAHAKAGPQQHKEACAWYRLVESDLKALEDTRAKRILARRNLRVLLTSALSTCVAQAAMEEQRAGGAASARTIAEAEKRLTEIEELRAEIRAAAPLKALSRPHKDLGQILNRLR